MSRLTTACAEEATVRTSGFPKSAQKLHADCDGCDCPHPHTPREDTTDARH